ncbi:MAG: SCO1664 family protein [Acidimicrobiia bacterium]|nr:SCO1664 family protein [Acidimicrobiia bacterium]
MAADEIRLSAADVEDILTCGHMEVIGRLPRASNATLFVKVTRGDIALPAVYKPRRGERPLWDFRHGTLYRREVAAYVLSEAVGWSLVPPTVERGGEFGVGSVQLFVAEDDERDMLELVDSGDDSLQPIAVLDVLLNNADRKVSHCMFDESGRLWGIDHGLTFHDEPKLRTVLWAWAGERVPAALGHDVAALGDHLAGQDSGAAARLAELLDDDEIEALLDRIELLARSGRFPEPDPYGHPVPWPPY